MNRLVVISIISFSIFAGSTRGKDWRGITPLRSTRADVERVLGKPNESQETAAYYYDLPTEIAVVEFQAEGCDTVMGKFGFGWNVAPDKVTFVGTIPKSRMTKETAGVTKDFKVDDKWGGFIYYDEADEGYSVEVLDGVVTNIRYQPTSKDDSLKCPTVQKCCWDLFPKVDEFTHLPSKNDELARYIYFIQQMKLFVDRGLVLIKGRNPTERKLQLARAQRAVKDACQKLKFPIQRIMILDGGYHEFPLTELEMYPIAGEVNWIYLQRDKDPDPKSVKK